MLAFIHESMIKNVFFFWCCTLVPPVVSISPLEIPHPSYLEYPMQILVIVWGVSSLVEFGVWGFGVLIVVLVYLPLGVDYPPLELGWYYLAMVVLDGILCVFYLLVSLCLTSCLFPGI